MSRLTDENIESLLEKDAAEEKPAANEPPQTASDANYYSEPEMTPMTSPLGSRPGTPVLSDTEYETKQRGKMDATPPGANSQQR